VRVCICVCVCVDRKRVMGTAYVSSSSYDMHVSSSYASADPDRKRVMGTAYVSSSSYDIHFSSSSCDIHTCILLLI
jgi:hypothetical protein